MKIKGWSINIRLTALLSMNFITINNFLSINGLFFTFNSYI